MSSLELVSSSIKIHPLLVGGAIIKLAQIYFGLNDFFMHEWC
jgi:hypothetical protein